MKKLLMFLLFCRVASPVEHSLKFLFTGSSGVTNFPEFVAVVMVDGVEVIYCDRNISNISRAEPKQDWMRKLMEDDPEHRKWYTEWCRESHSIFSTKVKGLMQCFGQTGGIHTLQMLYSCEWNNEAKKGNSFHQYSYDGEELDMKTLKCKNSPPPAFVEEKNSTTNSRLSPQCPQYLEKYVEYGNQPLMRTVLPSVSLLQKTPSSPVRCHATGFYPDDATLFWRKDGEELDEEMNHQVKLLPNHDGTFQMSVDLNISSVITPGDRKKYECVFQFGTEDAVVVKLDKAKIKTNRVEHSLKFLFTGSSGVTNFPEFVAVVMVDGVEVIYCDSNISRAEPKQDWMRKLMEDDPEHRDWYTNECYASQLFFSSAIQSLKQHSDEDVQILQRMFGCSYGGEGDDPFDKYGYEGEDFMEFNLETHSWIPSAHPLALSIKTNWDHDKARITNITNLLKQCVGWLKKSLHNSNTTLLGKVLPSVSLLQKTPSSPVSCHATGFFPDGAEMFWRKDGEELHEEMEQEFLPNHDGTFQMSVDLKLPSEKPEDWKKYECVFHLSGVEEDIVTKLDKAVIRTNWVSPPFPVGAVIGGVVPLLLIVCLIVAAFLLLKSKKCRRRLQGTPE